MGFGSSSVKLFGLLNTKHCLDLCAYAFILLSFLSSDHVMCVYIYDKRAVLSLHRAQRSGGMSILGDTKNWTGQSPEQCGLALELALWRGEVARDHQTSLPN